jgi:rhodanese-related sulfurtransferase
MSRPHSQMNGRKEVNVMAKELVRKAYFVLLLLALLVIVGCAPATAVPEGPTASNPTLITVEELSAMLKKKDFVLINVHIPYQGEIPGTDVHIPYNEIEEYADQLPQDKDAKIVLYCRSGSMSAAASKTLVEMGYTNVTDVQGGMKAWIELTNKFVYSVHSQERSIKSWKR